MNPNAWLWYPRAQAQSLQDLLNNNVEVVNGTMVCSSCNHPTVTMLNLQESVVDLRYVLEENRQRVLRGDLRDLPFGNYGMAKMNCPNCQKKRLAPYIPRLQKMAAETHDELRTRILLESNMLFLLLSKQLRFFSTEELHTLLTKFGFPSKEFTASDLVERKEPKPCFVPAAFYVLMQVLDPENVDLRLGSWPIAPPPEWNA